MKKQKGFSLIELLIVVAIILIIAAIAIPNLLRSKMAANEASAVGSIRSINTAEVTYSSAYPDTGYAAALGNLGGVCTSTTIATTTAACLLDNVLSTGTKSGYTFTAVGATGTSGTVKVLFTSTAVPLSPGTSGQRGFGSDQTGVIRYTLDGSVPSATASPLQ